MVVLFPNEEYGHMSNCLDIKFICNVSRKKVFYAFKLKLAFHKQVG